MDTTKIQGLVSSLVSYKIIAPEKEGEKTVLNFYLDSFTEEVGKKGAKVVVPATISKRSINTVAEIAVELTDNENKIEAVLETKGSKIVSLTDKKISGYGSWLDSRVELESDEERQTFTKFFLASALTVIAENEKTVSQADPLLEAKRIFAKSAPVSGLNYENAYEVFNKWETEELSRISRIMEKAKSLTGEDLKTFISEKQAANGLDEDGYVKLRGSKKEEESK